jgi:nucleotide-binding universal stress UspA family protein
MYKKILIANDDSDVADKAIEAGVSLGKLCGAEMIMLHVGIPMVQATVFLAEAYVGPSEEDCARELKASNDAADAKAAAIAAREGVTMQVVHLAAAEPWRVIIEKAAEFNCDAIVMASHGRGPLKALLLGSDTIDVLSHCKIPVLVVR